MDTNSTDPRHGENEFDPTTANDSSIRRAIANIKAQVVAIDENIAFHEGRVNELRDQRSKLFERRRQIAVKLGLVDVDEVQP